MEENEIGEALTTATDILVHCARRLKEQEYSGLGDLRPWPNDSIFHSIFSTTFDLKVERMLSVAEHMWPNGSIFLSTFQLLIFPHRMSAKNIYHHKYRPA